MASVTAFPRLIAAVLLLPCCARAPRADCTRATSAHERRCCEARNREASAWWAYRYGMRGVGDSYEAMDGHRSRSEQAARAAAEGRPPPSVPAPPPADTRTYREFRDGPTPAETAYNRRLYGQALAARAARVGQCARGR